MTKTDATTTTQVPLDMLFADLDNEFASTRRLLERFPDEHADWRPHERSKTLAALAAHIANLPGLGQRVAETPEFDFAATPFVPPTARTRAELLALFDERAAGARKAIADLDAQAMSERWRLRAGDQVFANERRGVVLRSLLISHTAHHRGQLTVYYRILGVPVPGLYGPSADEQ